MSIIFILATILLGFATVLYTVGHMLLVIFVAIPITRVLIMFGVFKPFRMRTLSEQSLLAFSFMQALIISVLIIILVTLGFLFFLNEFFAYLIMGYILGCLMISFNWFIRKTYSVNKNSFHVWYLDNFKNHINFDTLRRMKLDDKDKLFDVILTWATPEAQNKIKEMFKKVEEK